MITTATTVISLKGKIHEFGPSLELAPPSLIYVGRRMTMGGWRLSESDWANPFTAKDSGSAERAQERYAEWLDRRYVLMRRLPELRGMTLACWCKTGDPCHAVHLAKLAGGAQ